MNFSVYLLAKWNTMVYNVLDYIFSHRIFYKGDLII